MGMKSLEEMSPLQLLLAVILTTGVTNGGINLATDPRPDPYTGTQGQAEREARIAADATEERERVIGDRAETAERKAEDMRLRAKIDELGTEVRRLATECRNTQEDIRFIKHTQEDCCDDDTK